MSDTRVVCCCWAWRVAGASRRRVAAEKIGRKSFKGAECFL
jgi:hypothetical protein